MVEPRRESGGAAVGSSMEFVDNDNNGTPLPVLPHAWNWHWDPAVIFHPAAPHALERAATGCGTSDGGRLLRMDHSTTMFASSSPPSSVGPQGKVTAEEGQKGRGRRREVGRDGHNHAVAGALRDPLVTWRRLQEELSLSASLWPQAKPPLSSSTTEERLSVFARAFAAAVASPTASGQLLRDADATFIELGVGPEAIMAAFAHRAAPSADINFLDRNEEAAGRAVEALEAYVLRYYTARLWFYLLLVLWCIGGTVLLRYLCGHATD